MLLEKTTDQIYRPDASSIAGLAFRLFRDESDYAHIVELINTCGVADGLDDHVTLNSATNFFTHLAHFNPRRNILFATIDDRPAGYVRAWMPSKTMGCGCA